MTILCVLTDKEDGSKILYSISDEGEIIEVTQDDVRKQFEYGMRTLSKSKETELKEVLFGTSEQTRTFQEQEVGKGTINIPTEEKDKVNIQVSYEQLELQQNIKEN